MITIAANYVMRWPVKPQWFPLKSSIQCAQWRNGSTFVLLCRTLGKFVRSSLLQFTQLCDLFAGDQLCCIIIYVPFNSVSSSEFFDNYKSEYLTSVNK